MRHRNWRPAGTTAHLTTVGQIPEVGQVIGMVHSREAWRVLAVTEIHQANWDPATLQEWERVGRPDPETWSKRERSVIVEPPRNPAPNGRDRRGMRICPWWNTDHWWPLPDPYPACIDCGLLWPCPCDDRNKEAAKAMAEVDRLAAVLPGCCWACGEPIAGRQRSIEFVGENLLLPGASPAVFHTAHSRKAVRPDMPKTCREQAEDYETHWVAAEPGRTRRLTCAGRMFRHFTFSECTAGADCPGEDAFHQERSYCTTTRYTATGRDVRPATNCGERMCRGQAQAPIDAKAAS